MPLATPAARAGRSSDRSPAPPKAPAAPSAPAGSLLRGVAVGAAPLRPGEVMQLQRALGNRAVVRLLGAPGAGPGTLQRAKRFDSLKGAEEYVRENPPDRKKETTQNKYFNRLKQQLGKSADREDQGWLQTAAAAAWAGSSVVERKPLSAEGWKHIWCGELGSKGRPTGFHWKGKADEAVCETYGDARAAVNGFYHQPVRFKDSAIQEGKVTGTIKNKLKADASTFFPDDWTEQEVKDAIELRNSSDQITTPLKGAGVKLRKAGDTIYPDVS